MKSQLNKDLSLLTNLPEKILDKLAFNSLCCICSTLEESNLKGEEISEIDLGYGTLKIQYKEGTLKYKFVPSPKLEKELINTIKGQCPTSKTLETSLAAKFNELYKDLC